MTTYRSFLWTRARDIEWIPTSFASLYSSDLTSLNYYLRHNMKKLLPKKKDSIESVIAELNASLEKFVQSYYSEGIIKIEQRWAKCTNRRQEVYVEK